MHKGGVLDLVLTLQDVTFSVTDGILEECQELRQTLLERIDDGRVQKISDEDISAERVADIANGNNLGLGESECVACCEKDPTLTLCTDDRRARNVASGLLGAERVIGTEDLLLECVRQSSLAPLDAYTSHELMRRRGAFLPERAREFFILND